MSIEQRVLKVIREFNNSIVEEIQQDDPLREVGVDSLGLVNVIVSLEDEFHIEFQFSNLKPSEIIYVRDLINLVAKHCNNNEERK